MQKPNAGAIRLHPFTVDNELRDGALSGLAQQFLGSTWGVFNVNLCMWDVVLGEEALCLATVTAPGGSVDEQSHTLMINAI